MKHFNTFIFLCVCTILTSCATAIKTPNVELTKIETELNSTPQMDFIGFKVDSNILSTTQANDSVMSEFDQAKAIKDTKALRNLGYTLESARIAQDKSYGYFGIYSLQELELYKSSHRYVTFIEVAQSKFNWDDNKTSQKVRAGIGGGLVGEGLLCTIFGGVFKGIDFDESKYSNAKELNNTYDTLGNVYLGIGIPSMIVGLGLLLSTEPPTKTDIKYDGLYNIYVYDSQVKELIRREAINVNINEKLEGSYDYDYASKNTVNDYLSAKISNALLEKYQELSRWLKNR